MVQRGMAAMDAIKATTSVAAYHMDWDDDVGAIEAGRFGDLIAVRCDPLADITVLKSIDVVIKGGLIFKLPDARQYGPGGVAPRRDGNQNGLPTTVALAMTRDQCISR